MVSFQSLIILITLCQLSLALPHKRQSVGAQTSWLIEGCSAEQVVVIKQAHADALLLASAALEDSRELLVPDAQAPHKYINWHSKAAIDFFGPPNLNRPYGEYIVNTFYRAIQSRKGLGWSDWWNDRYVRVYCRDTENACDGSVVAYNTGQSIRQRSDYPQIVYCPYWFNNLTSHADMVETVRQDPTKQWNVRNIRSQATTVLHEWLHIRGYSAEICIGGCDDTYQTLRTSRVRTYKAGLAKLLARRDPSKAAQTNDNYAYFAMSKFMEKTFGTYPTYPLAWDPSKSASENLANERSQPGFPLNIQSTDTDEDPPLPNSQLLNSSVVDTAPLPSTQYPTWYQPLANAIGQCSAPNITEPRPIAEPDYSPNLDSIVCETNATSPRITDCAAAFQNFWTMTPWQAVPAGQRNESFWVGSYGSCALSVDYTDDWSELCLANTEVVRDHSTAVFRGCLRGDLGTVGGYVDVALPGCDIRVSITNTVE